MIGRNILYNAIGGSWTIILYLLIVPVQIRFLGIDAFGLLAFISSLQVVFSIFDFGLSMTLAREVAVDDSPELRQTRALLQSLFTGYALLGVLLGAGLLLGANWLVRHWLELGSLPATTAVTAMQLAGVAIALRWPVSFLSSVLIGRGRFDLLNLLKFCSVSLAVAGGLVVILRTGDLVAFAAWNAFAAAVEIVLYLVACYRLVPQLSLRPRVSMPVITQVWRFARDMSIIYVLSTILIQSDRLVLSRMVPIDQFGYYTLAFNLLFGLTIVQGFITTAMLPAFAATFQRGAKDELNRLYFLASQGLIALYTPAIAVMIFFGGDFLRIWTTAETAASSVQILQVLAPAFLLNAAMAVTTTLAIAAGMTGLIVRFNVVALVFYLPALYLAISAGGPVGAAAVWLGLNIAYLVGLLPLVQRGILGDCGSAGYWPGTVPLVITGAVTFGLARVFLHMAHWQSDLALALVTVVAGLSYSLIVLRLVDPVVRDRLVQGIRGVRMASA